MRITQPFFYCGFDDAEQSVRLCYDHESDPDGGLGERYDIIGLVDADDQSIEVAHCPEDEPMLRRKARADRLHALEEAEYQFAADSQA